MSGALVHTDGVSLLRGDARHGKLFETVLPIEAGAQTARGIVMEPDGGEHCTARDK